MAGGFTGDGMNTPYYTLLAAKATRERCRAGIESLRQLSTVLTEENRAFVVFGMV